jgi:glutamate synthase (NADPH/NADH) large chain
MTGGVVVVLGHTGRNFAAGMSGGVAYVLDDDGSFSSRCNLAMVDLEPMPEEEDINAKVFHHARDLEAHGLVDIMSDLSGFDAHRLHHLITRHARFTGSALAGKILADWKSWYPKFRKIMPVEYRRALNELKAASIAAE